MTNEEKFLVDLEGYLVIEDVLTPDELDELNKIIDQGIVLDIRRAGAPLSKD